MASGCIVKIDAARARNEIARRVFSVDATFDGVVIELYLFLGELDGLAASYQNLLFDEIDSGDLLRYRMLDLNPRIHLKKEKLALVVNQKFDGAGSFVVRSSRRVDSGFAHPCSQFGVNKRRGRLFD